MDKLQTLLKNIEQQFGYTLEITDTDIINAKELSIDNLQKSRDQIQEQIDHMLYFAFICLKNQIAIVKPLTRMQAQIDNEIAALKALPNPKPLVGMKE